MSCVCVSQAGIIHKGSYAVASRKDRGHEDNVIAAFSSSSSSVTIQNAGYVCIHNLYSNPLK